MIDAACARYGHQDIHRIRGVKRLRRWEKEVFVECVKELMTAEFSPDASAAEAVFEKDE